MTEAERRLIEDRATRNAARQVFDCNVAQVKADLSARSIPGRVADKAASEARGAFETGLDVARESKGIIAGTLALLALWFLRNPLMAALGRLRAGDQPAGVQDEPANADDTAD